MPPALQQRLLDLVSRTGELLGSPRMEDVLPGILAVARDTVAADGYAVWRLDRDRGVWYVASHAGVSDRFAAAMLPSALAAPPPADGRPEPIAGRRRHDASSRREPPRRVRRGRHRVDDGSAAAARRRP